MKTYNNDPNFSIVMPGGCNAKCSFCFNVDKKNKMPKSTTQWLLDLKNCLLVLPKQFYQISITGNEPMLSPQILNTLEMCAAAKTRYTNILLTTNGTGLLEHLNHVARGVHHINISRHHYDESENKKIFGGHYNVTDNYLAKAIDIYSAYGVDISLNCVIDDNTTKEFIENYINFAKKIGARAVRFRKKNGDSLDKTPAELAYDDYPVLAMGKCPVCRTYKRVIHGMDTYWKAAIIEPTDKITDSVYELVYNTDGKLYTDWNYKKPYKLENKIEYYDDIPFNSRRGGCSENFYIPECGRSSGRSSCGISLTHC